jgi:5-methyltetrahydrofolate--homocysteine methyltransferase
MSLIAELVKAVTDGDVDKSKDLATTLISSGTEPVKILNEGLTKGLMIVGDKFGRGEAYLMELMMSAQAMKSGLHVIEPELKKSKVGQKHIGIVVIGTVEGDIHDIGKTIVATMFEVNGFKVYDLGCDVKSEAFLEKVKEVKPNILGLSALLSTTMVKQAEVIKALTERGMRSGVKIMIGGAPITQEWAREIGADDSAPDAITAVSKAKALVTASQANQT